MTMLRLLRRGLTASLLGAALLTIALSLQATPPEYRTFKRDQERDYSPDPADLLRIWIAHVGQGDGILIQLPPGSAGAERVEVLVDGGSHSSANQLRMLKFIESLYASEVPTIEYAVITHHDSDHIVGLTRILEGTAIGVRNVFHNGLASFAPGARGLPRVGLPRGPGVYNKNSAGTGLTKALGLFAPGGSAAFDTRFVMTDLADLQRAFENDELQGNYEKLAAALVEKELPTPVEAFERAFVGAPFIAEREGVRFEVLWPSAALTRYPVSVPRSGSGWGETINGNSITFRLTYGDFEMLFTGDHNDKSQKVLLDTLSDQGRQHLLECDVLKVPHHGSNHAFEPFFRATQAVLGVTSQGDVGARSSRMTKNAWEHPSPEVVRWLGGAHRVYHTQLKEKRFAWEDIDSVEELEALYEPSHVLIETDGDFFRIVELPLDWQDLNVPPSVLATQRSDGTRWVAAKE